MTPNSSVIQALQSLTHWTAFLILPLVGIAALTMAIIQTAKNMFPLRYWFQRSYVESWLAGRTAPAPAPAPQTAGAAQVTADPIPAKEHLVRLATSDDAHALYSLPIEQLCGQINASTQVLLDYPDRHWDLLRCLASQADPNDLATLKPAPAVQLSRKALLRKPAVTLTEDEHNQVDELVAARNRVSHHIQRAVDALQISLGFRWKFWMQLASILISAFLGFVALVIVGHPLDTPSAATFILLSAIFSGLIASSVRDLLAAFERTRS